jgi:hypothetical protein
MSDTPIGKSVSAGDRVASKVFRSELNPVDFLRRAAYVYPEKTAGGWGAAATPTVNSRSARGDWPMHAGRRD